MDRQTERRGCIPPHPMHRRPERLVVDTVTQRPAVEAVAVLVQTLNDPVMEFAGTRAVVGVKEVARVEPAGQTAAVAVFVYTGLFRCY